MLITHLGHACLLLEMADTRVLVDPGTFADDLSGVSDLAAVLVTHQHPDHLDVESLPGLLSANSGARLVTDPETAKQLQDKGIDAEPLQAGDELMVGAVTVSGVGEMHALIHDDIPRIHNTGMRLTAPGEPTFFHPGDALDAEPGQVDVLAFPLSAPWARSRDMTGFLRRLAVPHAIPVHDALLSEVGRTLYLTQAGNLGWKETQIHDLSGGRSREFHA